MSALEQEKSSVSDLVTAENLVVLVSSVVLAICYDIFIAQPYVAVAYPIFMLVLLVVVYGNTKPLLVKEMNLGWVLVFPLAALL